MKDDIDNNKLNQPDSDMDVETPTIPGETEPDTTNTNDGMSDPYAAPTSSIDGIKSTGEDSEDAADVVDESPVTDEPDNTDKVYDPISDFNPSDESAPTSETQNNIGAPSSTTMPDFVAPAPAVETKKSKRSKIILGFMVFVLLLALGGFVYWYYYMQPSTDNNTTPVATESVETKTSLSYTDVIKDLKSDTPEKVAETFPTAKAFVVDDQSSPVYKFNGDNFYMVASGDNQTVYVQSDGDKKFDLENGTEVDDKYIKSEKPITDAFVAYFNEKDFEEVRAYDQDLPLLNAAYKNDKTICEVSSNEYPAYVTCAPMDSYTSDQAKLAPMNDAMRKATKNKDTTIILYLDSTKTNQDLGYESAEVGISDVRATIGGSAELFYKKVSDKNWAYFNNINSVTNCSDYDTYAKQAAFAGRTCYNQTSDKNSTVKVTAEKPKEMKAL